MNRRHLLRIEESQLPSFESFVVGLTADKLKVLARSLVGKEAYKMNKAACLAAVGRALCDDTAIASMVQGLSPWERWGLGMVKLRGGRVVSTEEIAGELLMYDPQPTGRQHRYGYGDDNRYAKLNGLLDCGLLIRADRRSSGIDRYYPCAMLVADPRMLRYVAVTPPVPLTMVSATPGGRTFVKRQSELALQVIGLGQALRRLRGLPLTASGARAKPAVAKLAKLLGEQLLSDHGRSAPLADRVGFFLSLWDAAGLLDCKEGKLVLDEQSWGSIVERPANEQAATWVEAYRGIYEWVEHTPEGLYLADVPSGPSKFNCLRAALLTALAALPDAQAWYRIADLADAMYERMGRAFSLGYPRPPFFAPYDASPYAADRKRVEWEQQELQKWRQCEQVWIAHAIAGPLYHLGLVELAHGGTNAGAPPDCFRLSDTGRAAIYDVFRSIRSPNQNGPSVERRTEACWLVQPNFDVVVYLDRADPRQLTFIERLAERQQVGDAIATYRLTREATYEALESGLSVETMLRMLTAGSMQPLPAGVTRSLSDWAARRERLTVHLGARVIEFDDAETRDAALASGQVQGRSVGDRFVLVDRLRRTFTPARIISYEPAPPRCLTVGEAGNIEIDGTQRDLLIEAEIADYAEPDGRLRWRISPRSVRAGLDRGLSSEQIVERLSRRASHSLAPILVCAIHAWGGTALGSLRVSTVEILQVVGAELAEAIAKSRVLSRHLAVRLGPTAFLVKSGRADALREQLAALGLPAAVQILGEGSVPASTSSSGFHALPADPVAADSRCVSDLATGSEALAHRTADPTAERRPEDVGS